MMAVEDTTVSVRSYTLVELAALSGTTNFRRRSDTRTTSAGPSSVSPLWWWRTISSIDTSSISGPMGRVHKKERNKKQHPYSDIYFLFVLDTVITPTVLVMGRSHVGLTAVMVSPTFIFISVR